MRRWTRCSWCTPRIVRRSCRPVVAAYADFVDSRPPAPRSARRWRSASPPDRAAGAHPAPVGRVTRCGCCGGPAAGRPGHRRDLPALPDARAEDVPDGATEFKCCPPIRDAANRTRCGRPAPTAHRLRGVRPLAVHARPQARDTGDFAAAWGGIASLQLGLPVSGPPPGRRASRCPTWCAGWPAPGRPGRAGAQGPLAAPEPTPTLVAFDPFRDVDRRRAALHHRNPVHRTTGASQGRVRDHLAVGPGSRWGQPRGTDLLNGSLDSFVDLTRPRLPPARGAASSAATTSSSPPLTTSVEPAPGGVRAPDVRGQGPGVRRLGDPARLNPATTGRSCGSAAPGIVRGVVIAHRLVHWELPAVRLTGRLRVRRLSLAVGAP
jgi:hypothetical protein